jgi:prepilin-type N-terminal cleavage/methylation domain-containing protein
MKKMIVEDRGGFTLIEALTAIVILTIGVFSLYSMQITAIDGNAKAARITYGTGWTTDQIENMIGTPFDDLEDVDGDGTNKDTNTPPNGVDNSGENFGLNDVGGDADGSLISPDGFYTIFWNVAVDHPMPDLKSIRLIVQYQDKGEDRSITMDYIKPSM